MSEPVIKVNSVTKSFVLPHQKTTTIKTAFLNLLKGGSGGSEVQTALKNVSLSVSKGEFFGIVGRNGSGKSTLLKILAGIYQPNSGDVSIEGRLVPFIELGLGFNGELTGRDNIYLNGALLGFSKSEIDNMYPDIVSFAELEKFMDQKLKNYSSGMQVRLAFSLATRAKADILLVDEVLAVGDADFQRKCFDYFKSLKKTGTTVVFVTHDMNAVREYCDRAILIDKNKVVFEGSAEMIAEEYAKLFAQTGHEELKNTGQRWGDEKIKYSSVKVEANNKEVSLILDLKAAEYVDSPVFGFGIRSGDGEIVFGANTVIKKKVIKEVREGESKRITWTFPNILSDGNYTVDVSAHDVSGSGVYDWWEGAGAFRVNKDEKLPYSVNPDVKVKVS